MRLRIGRILCCCIGIMQSVLSILVVVLLVVFQKNTEYNRKTQFLLSNGVLLTIGVFLLILAAGVYYRFHHTIDVFFDRLPDRTILLLSLVLFLVQAYVFYNIYFLTRWDVYHINSTALFVASNGEFGEVFTEYFSRYPNNFVMTWLLSVIYKFAINFVDNSEYTYIAILVQSLLACISGYCLFKIVKEQFKSTYAYLVWLLFSVHIGLSPWLSIPYTDAMALCVPIVTLRIYQLTQNKRYTVFKWCAIGFITFFGFKIKPQCLIVFVAICLSEIIEMIKRGDRKVITHKARNLMISVCAGILAWVFCSSVLIPSMNIPVDPNAEFKITHHLMMGLNTERDGVYLQSDVDYSASFATVDERVDANIDAAKQRLSNMGFLGFMKHLAKKTLVNFADGTYAWSQEGNFYSEILEDRNCFISPLLKSMYYAGGENYLAPKTFQHFLWILIIFGSCFVSLYFFFEKTKQYVCYAAVLSMIGITLFQTIFEARARYLFIYSPIIVMVALMGYIGISKVIPYIIHWLSLKAKKYKKDA